MPQTFQEYLLPMSFQKKLKSGLHNFKDWLQKQMSIFVPFFWRKMAQWTKKFAAFSQQKATQLNTLELPSISPELKQTVPVTVVPLLKALHNEIRLSRELLENLANQQNETNKKIALLESQNVQEPKPIEKQAAQPKLADQMTVESANELRILLEKQHKFDEKLWLKLWQKNPTPYELATRLVNQYSPINCKTEIYKEIAIWLEKNTGKEIHFILPEINQEYESLQHELVEHRAVKGRANRILAVKRPGLCYDDAVQIKAQVVSS
jgi:hypothetical protein